MVLPGRSGEGVPRRRSRRRHGLPERLPGRRCSSTSHRRGIHNGCGDGDCPAVVKPLRRTPDAPEKLVTPCPGDAGDARRKGDGDSGEGACALHARSHIGSGRVECDRGNRIDSDASDVRPRAQLRPSRLPAPAGSVHNCHGCVAVCPGRQSASTAHPHDSLAGRRECRARDLPGRTSRPIREASYCVQLDRSLGYSSASELGMALQVPRASRRVALPQRRRRFALHFGRRPPFFLRRRPSARPVSRHRPPRGQRSRSRSPRRTLSN